MTDNPYKPQPQHEFQDDVDAVQAEIDQEDPCLDCDKPEDESCHRYCWAVQSDWGAEE